MYWYNRLPLYVHLKVIIVPMYNEFIPRLHNKVTIDALQSTENVASYIRHDITIASVISDVIWGFYLYILGDDIFRTLQRTESNQPYYTTLVYAKENWIQGGGTRVSVHFAMTYLDCWRTSFCVITIMKIVNNNTNDKQILVQWWRFTVY